MLTTPGVVNYVVSCALKLVTLTERSALAQPFYSKSANVASSLTDEEIFLAQRRKGAKKNPRSAVALCAFAPLRETLSPIEILGGLGSASRARGDF